jgi:hypothetical protein
LNPGFNKFAGSEFERTNGMSAARRAKYREVRSNPGAGTIPQPQPPVRNIMPFGMMLGTHANDSAILGKEFAFAGSELVLREIFSPTETWIKFQSFTQMSGRAQY